MGCNSIAGCVDSDRALEWVLEYKEGSLLSCPREASFRAQRRSNMERSAATFQPFGMELRYWLRAYGCSLGSMIVYYLALRFGCSSRSPCVNVCTCGQLMDNGMLISETFFLLTHVGCWKYCIGYTLRCRCLCDLHHRGPETRGGVRSIDTEPRCVINLYHGAWP